jgi:RNA polymerase sigma-70 factor (ECF subfamily)
LARHDLPQPSQQFLDELVKHDKFILDCCLRLCKDKNDAQDLRQDVYMKALRFCDGYQEGTNMKGWLVSISKNTYINRFKKKGKSVEVSVESIADPVDYADYIDTEDIDRRPDAAAFSEELVKAIESLDEDYKNIAILVDVYGYNYKEVAEMKGMPEGTIKSRLFRARGILREALAKKASQYGVRYVKRPPNRSKNQ